MKRVILAAALLISCVSFSAWYSSFVTEELTKIKTSLELDENAVAQWREKRRVFAVLLKHEELDEVDRELFSYEDYIRNGDAQLAHESAVRAAGIIDVIINGEKLCAENII